ncbi:MAG: SDR family NAD(P)-dependent oxidoreductase [Candidatus Binatia bacterium]
MSAKWFDLSGKVAVITGGSKGLGRAIAAAMGRAGADVVITSRTPADLEAVAAELREHGHQVLSVRSDMTDEASIRAMVRQVVDHFGHIDILVNNAGIEGVGAIVEMDTEYWDHVLDVNLRGPMLCCKYVGPHMISRQRGKVINVASVLASRVARYMGAYAASKAAVVQLTRTLALEWIRHNIQVNALCPGYFLTPMNEAFFATEAGRKLIADLPIGRLGETAEIEGAAVFLASDATSYITGTTLYVDGGHSLA